MFKKKAPKVILRNIKHFSNKNDISLSKFRPDNSIYSDVNSPFGDDEDVSMTGVNNESLLDLVATTSKTKHIIKSIFTSEISIKKAVLLAKKNKIIANIDVKKQEMHSDQTVIIKKNFIDTPKEIIITAVSKFGIIKLIKIQLIEIWQKTVIEFAKLD
ncbi:hypothetical protein G9A89_004771 [Geosiphon pyriformis]|nr:hypothetical protein G9A89_004771 [Geosiphon pyriformis]